MPLKEPAVSRRTLELTAGALWALVGIFLSVRAALWIPQIASRPIIPIAIGLVLGVLKGRFVFARLARANIARINALSPHKAKICIFAFQAMQSYLIAVFMIALGIILRMSPLPRSILVAVYLTVGVALAVGSVTYLTSKSHTV